MFSARKRKKRARVALRLAEAKICGQGGKHLALPKAETELIEGLIVSRGDDLVGDRQPGVLERTAATIEHFHSETALRQSLDEHWKHLMMTYTTLALDFYLCQMGYADLGERYVKVAHRRLTERKEAKEVAEQTVTNIPTDELALLLDGPANINDPEFRSKAPELARLFDEALARDAAERASGTGVHPPELIDGLATREPQDMRQVPQPGGQHFTAEDLQVLRGIYDGLAQDDSPGLPKLLTYYELESLRQIARGHLRERADDEHAKRVLEIAERELSIRV